MKRLSLMELILYLIIWVLMTVLSLRIAIPMVTGKLPVNGILIIAACVLAGLASAMVYELFKNKDS